MLAQRLKTLRDWKWGSYRAYAGYCDAPAWLTCDALRPLSGGRTIKEQQAEIEKLKTEVRRLRANTRRRR